MILGAAVLILAISVPRVGSPPLEFTPGTSTNFTCFPRETDEMDRTTFALNHTMFHRNVIIPGVQFERQIRTTLNGHPPAVITTVTFDSRVCGLDLCCCYFSTDFNCRDCFLLVCSTDTEGTSTTINPTSTPVYTTSTTGTPEHHNSIEEFTTAFPEGAVIGLVSVCVVFFLVVIGVVVCVLVALFTDVVTKIKEQLTKNTTSVPTIAPNRTATDGEPAVIVETQTAPESDARSSAATITYRNHQQGNALHRGGSERLTGGGGDGQLLSVMRVHAETASEGSVGDTNEEVARDRTDSEEQTSNLDTSVIRLIFTNSARVFCPQRSYDVHGRVLPHNRIPPEM